MIRSKSFAIAVLLSFICCLYLGVHIHSSKWTMAADEAVHAIDGLRLYDDLHHGDVGGFLRHTYFSERWHPPVNNHLRWYPFVHSWSQAATFLVLGPSDFAARLPSVIFLFGSCLLFFAIAWRTAPERRSLSALAAVLLLLAAPNIVAFLPNGLIESSVFFMCYLALLAYIRFLEWPESAARAAVAGICLALAILTKYDHGILFLLAIGISEAVRANFHPVRLLRSRAVILFGTAAVILAVWFASPEKIAALMDASEHPFFGRPIEMGANYLTTWFLEYSTDPVVGVLMIVSLFAVYPYRRKPGIRAVWILAVMSTLFLVSRGRFRYRYNIVEEPSILLLTAILLPGWLSALNRALARWSRKPAIAVFAAGVVAVAAGIYWLANPATLFQQFAGAFRWIYGMRPGHWGLKLDPDRYVQFFWGLRGGFQDFEAAVLLTGAALLIIGIAMLLRRGIAPAIAAALAVTFLPGAVRLYGRAPALIDWEIGGAPALHQVFDLVEQHTSQRQDILLGGAWNNLANNSLRWYLLTDYRPRRFEDIHVWGATIGSIVLPPAPRVEYWAHQLAEAPSSQLPETVVLIEPTPKFLYHIDFDQDSPVYRRALAARDVYRLEASKELPDAGVRVDIYGLNRGSHAPPVSVDASMPPAQPVGMEGWNGSEDTWRHYWNRLIYPAGRIPPG